MRGTQKQAEFSVKQAPVLPHSNLVAVIAPLRLKLQVSADPFGRATLVCDIALFTVAFSTTKLLDELMRTGIQWILQLLNRSGLRFSFPMGREIQRWADLLLTISCSDGFVVTFSVRRFPGRGVARCWRGPRPQVYGDDKYFVYIYVNSTLRGTIYSFFKRRLKLVQFSAYCR